MRCLGISALILSVTLGSLGSVSAQEKKRDPIVGKYDWHNGNVVVIRADGTATSGEDQGGRWVANPYGGSGYVIMWEGGYVESLKLKDKGTKLGGHGLDSEGKAYEVSGQRKE